MPLPLIMKKLKLNGFYEDLQDLLELTPKNDVFFIIANWNAKVGSQEILELTCKFGLRVKNEPGQRLREFCQENTLVIANTPFQQRMDITKWSIPKSLIIFFAAKDEEALYSQQK